MIRQILDTKQLGLLFRIIFCGRNHFRIRITIQYHTGCLVYQIDLRYIIGYIRHIFFLDSYRFQFGILSSPLYSHFMFAFYPTVEKSRLCSEILDVYKRQERDNNQQYQHQASDNHGSYKEIAVDLRPQFQLIMF